MGESTATFSSKGTPSLGARHIVRFYNTLNRSVEEFTPLTAGQVKLYCCGPTVYLSQHIGGFRTYIFEDVLARTLRYFKYDVKHVMNITDVGHLVGDGDDGEDKMSVAMRREKKTADEIAGYYTDQFFRDGGILNIKRPDIICKATDHIQEMIDLTQRLEKNGFAYSANGNVYFDVKKFQNYGQLARLNLEKLQAGSSVEVDAFKRSPFDFALWFTKSKFENQEQQWDSPWGRGYPGWHIECSAMSMKYLGEEFDIHCGGIDHIPVHHTNEIAQSEGATGKPWVKYWMHGEFLTVDGEKMSKSKGNLYLIEDIKQRGIDPLAFRYLCLSSHYRSHMNFTWPTLENANVAFTKLKRAILALKDSGAEVSSEKPGSAKASALFDEFNEAMANDLNAPKALSVVWKVLNEETISPTDQLTIISYFDEIFGLGVAQWSVDKALPDAVQELVKQRDEARLKKLWSESDRLRDELRALGYSVEDSSTGTKIQRF